MSIINSHRTEDQKKLMYEMKFGDMISVAGMDVYRVPGGWLYTCPSFGVFVPFNNEYQIANDLPY